MKNLTVGVTNPYAVAELVVDKKIKWDSFSNPEKELSRILKISIKDIFDIKKPILNPNIDNDSNLLDDSAVHKRLKDFFKQHKKLKIKPGPFLPRHDVLDVLLTSTTTGPVTSNANAWKPANREWVDKGDYFEDVHEFNDPIQGALGDCYFIAAMASVSWSRPYKILNILRPSGWANESAPIHQVPFYKNGQGTAIKIEVSEKVPVAKNSHNWVYCRSLDSNEIWPAVMEKAYAKWKTKTSTDHPNYPAISGGDPVRACAEIVKGSRTYKSTKSLTSKQIYDFVRSNSLSKRCVNPMVAWTYGSQPAGTNYSNAKVVANHAYSVLGWEFRNNRRYIVLRNPWGRHHATLSTLSGTWNAHQKSYWAHIPLNTNGVFAMKASTFKSYFRGIGVVK